MNIAHPSELEHADEELSDFLRSLSLPPGMELKPEVVRAMFLHFDSTPRAWAQIQIQLDQHFEDWYHSQLSRSHDKRCDVQCI